MSRSAGAVNRFTHPGQFIRYLRPAFTACSRQADGQYPCTGRVAAQADGGSTRRHGPPAVRLPFLPWGVLYHSRSGLSASFCLAIDVRDTGFFPLKALVLAPMPPRNRTHS